MFPVYKQQADGNASWLPMDLYNVSPIFCSFIPLRCALLYSVIRDVERKCLLITLDTAYWHMFGTLWSHCVITKVRPLIDNEVNVEKCFIILRVWHIL